VEDSERTELFDQLLEETLGTDEIRAGLERIYREPSYLRDLAKQAVADIWKAVIRESNRVSDREDRLATRERELREAFAGTSGEVPPDSMVPATTRLIRWTSIISGVVAVIGLPLGGLLLVLSLWHPGLLRDLPMPSSVRSALLSVLGIGSLAVYVQLRRSTQLSDRNRVERAERWRRQQAAEFKELLESDRPLRSLQSQLETAKSTLRQALREKGILPFLRASLNDQLAQSYSNFLTIEQAPGLSELFDSSYEIPTSAAERLERQMSRMPGGSFGIAGPRGAGKTTLIRSFYDGRYSSNRRTLMVSAPVEYAPRDFILYLFATICRNVLGPTADEPPDVARRAEPPPLIQIRRWMLSVSIFAGSVMVGVGAQIITTRILLSNRSMALRTYWAVGAALVGTLFLYLSYRYLPTNSIFLSRGPLSTPIGARARSQIFSRLLAGYSLALVGCFLLLIAIGTPLLSLLHSTLSPRDISGMILAIVGALFIAIGLWPRTEWRRLEYEAARRQPRRWELELSGREEESGIGATARRYLDEIRFQQSYSSGWSGALKFPGSINLPMGIEATVSGSTTLARQQMSLPDIVNYYRSFVEDLATQRPVLIGIDELDKMESDERARQFLNDIKAIFGIKGCYYLVSVSEDAMASFERRGLPFRDVFDSAFDEVLKVPYLDLEDAKRLLSRRVIGLPMPFVCLCYCLSGGLARDLIRATRAILDASDGPKATDLRAICESVVRAELAAKTEAVTAAIKRIDLEPETSELLRWFRMLEAPHLSAARSLRQRRWFEQQDALRWTGIDRGGVELEGQRTLRRLSRELTGFYYYCATLLEIFNDRLTKDQLQKAEASDAGPFSLDHLARSRQTFAVNPLIAWSEVSDFRSAWGLDVFNIPSILST
jgi:hypothetical protein